MESQVERSYIVCTTPRSGSNMLCSLLESSSLAGIPSEIFYEGNIPKLREIYQLEADFNLYLQGIMRATTTENGVFGFKLMYDQLLPLVEKLTAITGNTRLDNFEILQKFFPHLRFVFLVRRNKVEQAISLLKANQTKVWWLPKHQTRDQPKAKPVYDMDEIYNCLRWVIQQEEGWRSYFKMHDIQPLVVYYEDIKKSPQSAKGILDYLEIRYSSSLSLQTKTEKQSDHNDQKWLVQYLYDRGHLTAEKFRQYIGG